MPRTDIRCRFSSGPKQTSDTASGMFSSFFTKAHKLLSRFFFRFFTYRTFFPVWILSKIIDEWAGSWQMGRWKGSWTDEHLGRMMGRWEFGKEDGHVGRKMGRWACAREVKQMDMWEVAEGWVQSYKWACQNWLMGRCEVLKVVLRLTYPVLYLVCVNICVPEVSLNSWVNWIVPWSQPKMTSE